MTNISTVSQFDYSSLDEETCEFIQQQTVEIRGLIKHTVEDIFKIGQKLIEIKKRLGYGHFGHWLASEFDWTVRTAQKFMNVAHRFNCEHCSQLEFAPSALYLLAATSTPEATWIKPGLQNKRTTRKGNQTIEAGAIKNICWGYTDALAYRYSPLWQTKPSSLPEGGERTASSLPCIMFN